ncbi:hypothetical protein J1605_017047 [Eschrichtius robustus]|uniref:Treslin n=1 Tax=Eschrichtius robustus TaxID=9764 RepID=A0AB34I306_ESCRO|nr:hypothetical protein J1605_017047 [Eschrichtius robustus]
MACCHNVMLLLDTAGGAAGESPVRRVALRLLTYLSCRFGLARVRWAFRFFDSQGARSRPSRVSDFRELGVRSWEDFEEELEARLGDGAHGAHLPGPAPRATHTHSALMETLLDYQWDRPEITSPTKPLLRSSGRRLLVVEGEAKEAESALGGFVNAVFLLAPCPHSQRELLQFVSGCEAQAQRLPPTPKQVMDKLLPKRVQEVMITRKITLYWVDTTEWPKVTSVDPGEGWPPITGVISPFSASATILSVFHTKETEFQRHFLQTVVAESPQDLASLFPEVVDGVLNQIHNSLEDPATSAPPTPEWAQQELGRTAPWNSAVVEKWFPCSNFSGASSNLMESFWLLQAASSNKEEPSKTESELTRCLSELYQRKSREEYTVSNQEDSKRKRGFPRTPVRQKMNTMCRSLKMLNVARLNVKAQKLHPDGSPDTAGEKGIQKIANGRTADKLENKGRTLRSSKPKDFKTEEELLSYIHENYRKTVATGEIVLYSCARNMISNIKAFLKSKGTKELEVTDMLRMVYLTEDSAYLAKFLEEILELYIDSIPKILGNLYDNLGFLIPQKLARVLPTDFFGDDSMTQESKSPLSVPLMSNAHRSVSGGTESDQLEELRTRSAKKRRKNAIRHKSIAEVSQNLRQIEIPKVSKRTTKNENSHPTLQQPPLPVKDTVQEVTKVRRNLFNQKMISPSKRSVKRGLPRSHSVSAVEGLEYKLDNFKRTKGYRKLLTKSVAETPVHKQISRRLLHRQIKGRSSDPGPEIDVVEESPEKGDDQRENSPIQSIRSPKRLLFGAVSEMISPSEKGSARIKRPSGSTLGSEIPIAYQTPEKSYWKSPVSSKATPRKFPHTPRTPLRTPERLQKSPAEMTPAKQVIFKEFLKDSSHGWHSPSRPKATPQKGHSLAEGHSPLEEIPRTPQRQGGQPPRFLQNSTWPHLVNSSPESTSCPAALVSSTAQTRSECLTPIRYSPRMPLRAAASGVRRRAAFVGTPPSQKRQLPRGSGASQAEKPAQPWNDAVGTPEKPGNTALTSPKKPVTSPSRGISEETPLGSFSIESPPSGELDWQEAQKSPSVATSPSCPAPSTPHKASQIARSDLLPPPPPSKIGKRHKKTSKTERNFPEGQPNSSAVLRVAITDNPAAITDARKNQKEATLSPPSPPETHSYPGTSFGSHWHTSSPLLIARDSEYLTLLDGAAEHHSSDNLKSNVSPVEEGEGSRMGTYEKPSLCNPGIPPSSPSSGPSSPLTPCYDLHCTADRKQCQAAAQLENLQASAWPSRASASPQTYEVELEMQASGLPKLRIKKIDPSCLSEAEPLRREESSLGEESCLPGLSVPRANKSSGKPEATYLSPPCVRPSHGTPGKSGGQTYICQSCTPTRCPSSTPSPFQTEVGVPWTPSPKHSGKTTPDTIKDWPRRKRAVDCGLSASAGRSEVGTDLPGGVSLLEPEGKEQGLEISIAKTPVLGDFELEGVCQLPDQSPPRDSEPKAEGAFSWGQFGLGSRKRLLSAKEEAECQTKRVCDKQRGDSQVGKSDDRSPGLGVRQLPSTAGDEVFVSGATPPPGCAVRSCLSASGLQALTHSPLLFHGKAPSSQCKDTRDEDVEVFSPTAEDSPFSRAFSRRRPISRTYTRKKLIS